MPQPVREKYIDESDSLLLEDELQRIVLKGNIDVQAMITGLSRLFILLNFFFKLKKVLNWNLNMPFCKMFSC
jgi:hypothetical protein